MKLTFKTPVAEPPKPAVDEMNQEQLIEALEALGEGDHVAAYIAAYSWHDNFEKAARDHLRKK